MRTALGKGLDALISEDTAASVSTPTKSSGPLCLPTHLLHANPNQPRRRFEDAALEELTASIRTHGILQPILVAASTDGRYEIIAGERRWRAATKAGLAEVPVVVKDADDHERFAIALVENIQREDLNPVEQAEGYRRLQDEFGWTQEKVAETVGKDRAVVANALRLLSLSEAMRAALAEGKISAGHGRALASIEDVSARDALFNRILAENLPVRHVEEAVRAHKEKRAKGSARDGAPTTRPAEVTAIEEELQRLLTRKIELQSGKTSQKGWIRLEFYSLDDLETLLQQLRKAATP